MTSKKKPNDRHKGNHFIRLDDHYRTALDDLTRKTGLPMTVAVRLGLDSIFQIHGVRLPATSPSKHKNGAAPEAT